MTPYCAVYREDSGWCVCGGGGVLHFDIKITSEYPCPKFEILLKRGGVLEWGGGGFLTQNSGVVNLIFKNVCFPPP